MMIDQNRSNGFNGKLLRVNLTTEKISNQEISLDFYRMYLGGSGLTTYFLLKEIPAKIDPLGPENKLVFATGPLTGVAIPGAGRHSVGAKSPLTGGIALSEVGEFWGAELKKAGYDILIIEGRSARPVYLKITDGRAELCEAAHLWGKSTKETQRIIRQEMTDKLVRVAMIGPGGENQVYYASIMHGLYNAAGRGGLGAVMGSKNVKAIAVRGKKRVAVFSPEQVKQKRKWFIDNMTHLPVALALHTYGTGANLEAAANAGNLPVRNFRDGLFPQAAAIDPITIAKTIRIGMRSCYSCPVKCKKVVAIGGSYSYDSDYGGPEYETIAALGSNCGIADIEAIVKGHEICNANAIDTISAGATIAFAMECFERGLLTRKETNGIDLRFGNGEAMLKMLEAIVRRDGIGDDMARGTALMAKKVGRGSQEFAMHVKGLEPGMHEPRLRWGLGLGFMVNPHGADHVCNMQDPFFSSSEAMEVMKPLGFSNPHPVSSLNFEKVALFRMEHLVRTLRDCLLMCWFCPWTPTQLAEILSAVTGWDTTIHELLRIAERVLTMARLFNVREGFSEKDDTLPKRFFKPKTDGVLSKHDLNPSIMTGAKKYYYTLMGWDAHSGIPLPEKIEELGIDWIHKAE